MDDFPDGAYDPDNDDYAISGSSAQYGAPPGVGVGAPVYAAPPGIHVSGGDFTDSSADGGGYGGNGGGGGGVGGYGYGYRDDGAGVSPPGVRYDDDDEGGGRYDDFEDDGGGGGSGGAGGYSAPPSAPLRPAPSSQARVSSGSTHQTLGAAGEFPADYIEAFQIYDKEFGDDLISAGTLGTVLRALGQNPTEGELSELVQTMGKDTYTVADVDFILRNYDLRDECSSAEIKGMWEMVAGGSAQTFVQKAALQAVLASMGDKIDAQDFNKIMMAANVDGDVVTFEQFERIMTH
jgi:calmodulin